MRTGLKTRLFGGALIAAAVYNISVIAAEALSGASKLMVVTTSKYPGKVHILPATLETTQWGWFDNAELPRLTVSSGDTVVIETMAQTIDMPLRARIICQVCATS